MSGISKALFTGAIFDMDGTLVDSLGFWPAMWNTIRVTYFADQPFEVNPAVDLGIRTRVLDESSKLVYHAYPFPVSEEEFVRYIRCSVETYYREKACVKPGMRELLQGLKDRGIPMAVASATDAPTVRKVLASFGIDGYFDEVVSCEDVGCGKDRPDVYIEAQNRLGVERSQAAVFEDSAVAIETAKNAGFFTVGIYDANTLQHDVIEKNADIYIGPGQNPAEVLDRL